MPSGAPVWLVAFQSAPQASTLVIRLKVLLKARPRSMKMAADAHPAARFARVIIPLRWPITYR